MPEMWGKKGIICVETRTFVGTLYVRRKRQYKDKMCDV